MDRSSSHHPRRAIGAKPIRPELEERARRGDVPDVAFYDLGETGRDGGEHLALSAVVFVFVAIFVILLSRVFW